MADLTGGKRDRMIFESVYRELESYLSGLGWFSGGRYHQPVTYVDEFPDLDDTNVQVNTLAVSYDQISSMTLELGSRAAEHTMVLYVDFFAENDAVGRHLSGDVVEYLRTRDAIPVRDYSDTGDPIEFYVELEEDVDVRKPDVARRPWQKHWYTVEFAVEDVRSHGS